MQFDDDEIYFKCPNCPATYNFTEFYKLEHKSHADPSEGADILGHAKCRKCSKDFYYYLTSDAFPIVVTPDFPDIPDEILFGAHDEASADFPFGDMPVPQAAPNHLLQSDLLNFGPEHASTSNPWVQTLDLHLCGCVSLAIVFPVKYF